MKLAALCCTYLRPEGLGQVIECFHRQDYPLELRELVILDDAGQYENQSGEGWRLVSVPNRFRSLGEKRNACAALASPDIEGILVADDDDIYLPHWFKTQAEALRQAEWSRPGLVLLEHGAEELREGETGGLYHGGWAIRKSAFYKVIGYGPHNNGEDQELAGRLSTAGVTECDPCKFADPFYVYRIDNNSYHLSYMDDRGYRELGRSETTEPIEIPIGWSRDWDRLPVIRRFAFGPHVNPKTDDGKMPVELIGPVDHPGGNGPSNGMYALQKELRKRIDEGLDWLSIKSLPVSKGALPWFWNWNDRRYAMWWDAEGLPFVQGPNMLFTNSASRMCFSSVISSISFVFVGNKSPSGPHFSYERRVLFPWIFAAQVSDIKATMFCSISQAWEKGLCCVSAQTFWKASFGVIVWRNYQNRHSFDTKYKSQELSRELGFGRLFGKWRRSWGSLDGC